MAHLSFSMHLLLVSMMIGHFTVLNGFRLQALRLSYSKSLSTYARKAISKRNAVPGGHLGYVDAHCHLFARQFNGRLQEVVNAGRDAGLEFAIINGLEPKSNRITLDMCKRYPEYLPAIGIYPLEACCNVIDDSNWQSTMRPPKKFDVDAEIDFIDQMCTERKIVAIGLCFVSMLLSIIIRCR